MGELNGLMRLGMRKAALYANKARHNLIQTITFAALYGIATASAAASFNCAEARTFVEQRICANPALGYLDEELAKAYKAAAGLSPSEVRSAQRAWLRFRNNCTDDSCLKMRYEQRLAEFGIIGKTPNPSSATPPLPTPTEIAAPLPTTTEVAVDTGSPASTNSTEAPASVSAGAPQPDEQVGSASVEPQAPPAPAMPTAAISDSTVQPSLNQRPAPPNLEKPVSLKDFLYDNVLFIGGGIIALLLLTVYGYNRKCPKCEKWFAAEELKSDLLDQRTKFKTVTREDKHLDRNGQKVGSVQRKEQIQVEVSTWRDHFKCTKCQHEWTAVSQTERS